MKEEMLINECSPMGFNIKESFKKYLIEESQPKKEVVEMRGNAMHPTIFKGSMVLVFKIENHNWKDLKSGVYAILFMNVFVIGRLEENGLLERYGFTLHFDNENFKNITFLAEEIQDIYRVDRIISQDVF
jgi:hypothetical protein